MPDPESDLEARKRRIRFRAGHRGMKETDLLFGRLAAEVLDDLDEPGVAAFERLLDVPDVEVVSWVSGNAEVPREYAGPLVDRLLSYRFDTDSYG